MQLTETQIEQANILIKKYGFCSLETERRLQEAGFFDKVECNMCITAHRYNKEIPCDVETIESALPYGETIYLLQFPQFHEVWEALPADSNKNQITLIKTKIYYLDKSKNKGKYDWFEQDIINGNICEAACLLWLKLKENNLL